MTNDLDELTRLVGTMPREMAREVLNFARYLKRRHGQGDPALDWEEELDTRYVDRGFDIIHPWDAIDAPAGARDLA